MIKSHEHLTNIQFLLCINWVGFILNARVILNVIFNPGGECGICDSSIKNILLFAQNDYSLLGKNLALTLTSRQLEGKYKNCI